MFLPKSGTEKSNFLHNTLPTPSLPPPLFSLVWSTLNATKPTVRWGTKSRTYTDSSPSKWSTYRNDDMCGDVAAGFGWREPGLIHVAVMDKCGTCTYAHTHTHTHTHIHTPTHTHTHTHTHTDTHRHAHTHTHTCSTSPKAQTNHLFPVHPSHPLLAV